MSGAGLVALALIAACGDDVGPPVASGTTGDVFATSGDGTPAGSGPGPADSGSSSGGETSETGDTMPQPPACGSRDYEWAAMLPGPGEDAFDGELERVARRHDRLHTVITSAPTGLAGDVVVSTRNAAGRDAIQTFLDEDGAWDFAGVTGLGLRDAVSAWNKATGAFAGVAVAADAYRYGVLRDQGSPCAEVDRVRGWCGKTRAVATSPSGGPRASGRRGR